MKVMINILEIDDRQSQNQSLKKAHEWMKDNLRSTPDKYESLKANAKPASSKRKL